MANQTPAPVQDPICNPPTVGNKPNPLGLLITTSWLRFLNTLGALLNTAANRISFVGLAGQNSALGGTPLLPTIANTGTYRLSYYMRVTTPAGVSSSLQITLAWTDGGVAQSFTGAALTSNTTLSFQTGTLLINADAATPISYSTAYASNAANVMRYSLTVTLEQIAV